MNYAGKTPEGTRDLLFAECRERRHVQKALTGAFRRWGYAEITTPEVEYYDLFTHSGSPMPQESMRKLIDSSGRILVMRPDSTTPIARVAATKLGTVPLPQRLYYDQIVFRAGQEHKAARSEIVQCGVELIGAAGAKADVEMVATAVDALLACGVEHFSLELGHVGFFRTLADRMEMSGGERETMRALIEGKSFAALGDLLAPHAHRPAWAALRKLSQLFGGPEVLDEAEALAGPCEPLDNLRSLYGELAQAGLAGWLRFDLGMVHQIDYYTGVVFRGYVQGAADAVLSGGRYDNLVGAFGRPAPATGFAVDVDAVAACLPPAEMPRPVRVIHYEPGDLAAALTALRTFSGPCELSPCRTLESTLNLAREKGAAQVQVLENGGTKEVIVL